MGLIEISLLDRQFTWSNIREDPYLVMLDRVLVSYTWEARFGQSKVYSIPKPMSDHAPICLDSSKIGPKASILSQFKKWWLEHDDDHNMIRMNWSLPIGEGM